MGSGRRGIGVTQTFTGRGVLVVVLVYMVPHTSPVLYLPVHFQVYAYRGWIQRATLCPVGGLSALGEDQKSSIWSPLGDASLQCIVDP